MAAGRRPTATRPGEPRRRPSRRSWWIVAVAAPLVLATLRLSRPASRLWLLPAIAAGHLRAAADRADLAPAPPGAAPVLFVTAAERAPSPVIARAASASWQAGRGSVRSPQPPRDRHGLDDRGYARRRPLGLTDRPAATHVAPSPGAMRGSTCSAALPW